MSDKPSTARFHWRVERLSEWQPFRVRAWAERVHQHEDEGETWKDTVDVREEDGGVLFLQDRPPHYGGMFTVDRDSMTELAQAWLAYIKLPPPQLFEWRGKPADDWRSTWYRGRMSTSGRMWKRLSPRYTFLTPTLASPYRRTT